MSRSRLKAVGLAALLAIATALGCATAIPYGAVGLRVDSNVPDATVWVDDVLVGNAADWARDGKHIRSGFHRIEIRHTGYYSFFQEVELPEGAHTVVNAKLRPTVD
jgi:PEGA domain